MARDAISKELKTVGRRRWALRIVIACALVALLLWPTAAHSQGSYSAAAQRGRALQFEQQGKLGEAASAWRALAKLHPNDPEPYARLGLIAAREEKYQEAAAMDRKALALNPRMPGLRLNLGLALFKGGDLKGAIAQFTLLRRAVPAGSPDAQRLTVLLAMSHYGLAQYAQAVPLLREAARQDAGNLPLRLALAHSCLWSKQYQCVLDTYHEMLLLNAESAEVDMLAGEALDEMNDKAGAVAQFRAAVKANPHEPEVHFGLGYLLWAQRRYDEAEPEFKLELANDPRHAQSMLYLGDIYLTSNKPEEAEPLLRKAVEIDPSLWRAYFDLGVLDTDAGRKDQAVSELESAEKLKPDEVSVHYRLARLYRTLGKAEAAKSEFDKANSLNKAADEGLMRKMNGAKTGGATP